LTGSSLFRRRTCPLLDASLPAFRERSPRAHLLLADASLGILVGYVGGGGVMPYLSRETEKSYRAERSRWLTVFAAIGLIACFIRLVDLQIIRGRIFEIASENNHTQILVEHAPRGRILDRSGKILADNRPVFVAFFSPLGLSPLDVQRILDRLSP